MKNMKKVSAVILAASMAMISLAGCGGSGAAETTAAATEAAKTEAAPAGDKAGETAAEEKPEAEAPADKTYRVALCLSGAANDMGWCQVAYEGLKLLESEYGCETAYTENLTPDDIEAAFADYAANGYDVVIGHGYEFGDPAMEVGDQFPYTKFIVTEGEVSSDNVASYVSKCEEGGYIMGMLELPTLTVSFYIQR